MLFSFPWWSYVIAFVVLHILGMAWHSKVAFGPTWMRVIGAKDMNQMSPEEKDCVGKSMGVAFGFNALITAITVLGIGYVANVFPFFPYITAIILCVLFTWTTLVAQIVWGPMKSGKLMIQHFLVSAGWQLLAFVVTGLILQWSV